MFLIKYGKMLCGKIAAEVAVKLGREHALNENRQIKNLFELGRRSHIFLSKKRKKLATSTRIHHLDEHSAL